MRRATFLLLSLGLAGLGHAQTSQPAQPAQTNAAYDLVIKGGHVIDPKNGVDAVRDVAIKDGKIAAVAADIPAAQAAKVVNATGLYVTPGLVDIHVHVYPGEKTAYAGGPLSVPVNAFAPRSCVTTVSDAGSAGWRNFDDFKSRIVDKSKTRVTAFLNIVGAGMAGGDLEQNLADMDAKATGEFALKHKGLIVGIKSAHYNGPEWDPFTRSVNAGNIANVPVMVDFGSARVRTIAELFDRIFRPGDIFSHAYAGGTRGELVNGKVNPASFRAQKKGIVFDIGHGGGSFVWRTAVQSFKEGFIADTISTDLHVGSMNAGMKDMTNVMSKFLALGLPLKTVIEKSTWKPAQVIKSEQYGHLSVGAGADVAVLRLDKGTFGFLDQRSGLLNGSQRIGCELTLRDGNVVWDLNGMAGELWETQPPPAPRTRPASAPSR